MTYVIEQRPNIVFALAFMVEFGESIDVMEATTNLRVVGKLAHNVTPVHTTGL